MIKIENRLVEKCKECPCFEATMYRDDIYTDHTPSVAILSVDCSNHPLCDSIERYLESREEK